MLIVVVTAVDELQRAGELIGISLETMQNGDRYGLELTVAVLGECADARGLAEAIPEVGLGFAGAFGATTALRDRL